MSLTRKLILAIVPKKRAEEMEAESKTWVMRCESCGLERSVWEVGGLRWKAAGNPTRRLRCPQCGHFTSHTTSRKHE
jgi:hypothetical protein